MHAGTNLGHVQAYNQRTILNIIIQQGPLSRADIARITSLTKQTVSNIVADLLTHDFITETGKQKSKRGGKPSINLALNPAGAFAIGIHLSRDSLEGVLVNLAGEVQARVIHELDYAPPQEAIPLMVQTAQSLQQTIDTSKLLGVGLAFPGPFDNHGNVVRPHFFPDWEDVPVTTLLSEQLTLPVYLENDATAAAIGEQRYGAGLHTRTFFYVLISMGLGGGLILNGEPYSGVSGNAGALGATPVMSKADGHIERLWDYISLNNLYQTLYAHGLKDVTQSNLLHYYQQENPHLLHWLNTSARLLAEPLANIETYFDPEAIVFGGLLPKELTQHLIHELKTLLPKFRLPGKAFTPQLLTAQAGKEAAALGAATLPIHEFLSPARNNRPIIPVSELSHISR